MEGYVTKNVMQCYATENLVKKDFTRYRLNTKWCTESMKDKFLTSVLFKFYSDLKGSTENAIPSLIFEHFEIKFSKLPNITCYLQCGEKKLVSFNFC